MNPMHRKVKQHKKGIKGGCPAGTPWQRILATTGCSQTLTRLSRLSGTFCLVLVFSCVPALHGLSASPEVADVAGFLVGFPQFRRLAESELSSQMKKDDMDALMKGIEDAAIDVGYNDDTLVAYTNGMIELARRRGLPVSRAFDNLRETLQSLPLLQNALTVGAILFSLGLVGILTRRNLIVMFLAAEMMLQGISVSLVAWSRYHGDWGGHVLVIFVLTVAACEAAVALVFVLQAFSRTGRLDAAAWQSLREATVGRTVDHELPAIDTVPTRFPTLAPAGILPPADENEPLQREHV
jgi:NADH-quinone oxidoreductase subunit K